MIQRRFYLIWGFIIVLTCSAVLNAEVKVSDGVFIDAQFRPRVELDNRFGNPGAGFDGYSTFRTRLGISLREFIEGTELYLQIADSRRMGFADPYNTGSNIGVNKFDNNLGVTKAYIAVNDWLGANSVFKIGRMSNNIGRNRIFGPGNWNYCGPRVYDGVRYEYKKNGFTGRLWHFYGSGGDRHWQSAYYYGPYPLLLPDSQKLDHTLTGIDVTFLEKQFNLLFFMDVDQINYVDNYDESHIHHTRYTAAVNYKNHDLLLHIDYDMACQFGRQAFSEGEQKIRAWMSAGDLSCHFDNPYKFWLGLGWDLVSGDDSDPDIYTAFHEEYYSKHAFQGHMDYFSSNEKSDGLFDFIFRAGGTDPGGLKYQVDLHYFRSEYPFLSASGLNGGKHEYGWEVDSTFDYNLRQGLKSRLGIGLFFQNEDWKGDYTKDALFIYWSLTAEI